VNRQSFSVQDLGFPHLLRPRPWGAARGTWRTQGCCCSGAPGCRVGACRVGACRVSACRVGACRVHSSVSALVWSRVHSSVSALVWSRVEAQGSGFRGWSWRLRLWFKSLGCQVQGSELRIGLFTGSY
jgi:hypothetical protein